MIITLRDRLGGHLATVNLPVAQAPASLALTNEVHFVTPTTTVVVPQWFKNFDRVINNPPVRVIYLENLP